MTRHMVSFTFVPGHQAEVTALIPEEQAHVKMLKENGIIEALYLSFENGNHGWIVMQATSKEEVQAALETFPLYPYMVTEIATLG